MLPRPALSQPCPGAGNLQGSLSGGCRSGPAAPAHPSPAPSRAVSRFHKNRVFTLKLDPRDPDWQRAAWEKIVRWVSSQIAPSPSPVVRALLDRESRTLSRLGFPVQWLSHEGTSVRVEVSSGTLNRLAERLDKIAHETTSYRIAHSIVSGGTVSVNRFVAQNLPASSTPMTSGEISQRLYEISQVPGITRADGLMASASPAKDVRFSKSLEWTFSLPKGAGIREIRRLVALEVAKRVIVSKEVDLAPLARSVADRLDPALSSDLLVQTKPNNQVHVTADPLLLNRLKNLLIQAAREGSGAGGTATPGGAVSSDAILMKDPSASSLENLLVHVTQAPALSGSQLEVDNYGYAPTGAVMLNATGTLNNAGMAGGLFNVTASTSFGGMASGAVGYSIPIGLRLRTGVDLTAMNYTLGLGFSPWGHGTNTAALTALGVSGSNYSGDLWASQALSERPDRKLVLKETLFLKEFQDTYSQTVQNDRSLLGGILDLSGNLSFGPLSLSFDLSDTEYDLSQGSGSSSQNPFYDSTPGLQNYLLGTGQIGYALSPRYFLSLGTVDQQYFGGGTLDPMLQATLGGVSNVMALPTASLFGNDLYAGMLTLTRTVAHSFGTLSESLFFDAGQVTGIGTNYAAMGPGIEGAISAPHYFGRIDLATPVGGLPTEALGSEITALTGGHLSEGGVPIQLWLSAGLRY